MIVRIKLCVCACIFEKKERKKKLSSILCIPDDLLRSPKLYFLWLHYADQVRNDLAKGRLDWLTSKKQWGPTTQSASS